MRRLALLVVVLVTACGGSSSAPAAKPTTVLPSGTGPAPVVVLVPGGSWTAADPRGLEPLAKALARGGAVATTTTYRTGADGRFPAPVEDVLCAAAEAVAQAKAEGRGGGPLVLVGHSAGGPLAVLAALRPQAFRGDCPAPPVTPDAVVGLAGAYDLDQLGDVPLALLGAPRSQAQDLWHQADVFVWANERPALPVLLVHGTGDRTVPPTMTTRLRDALVHYGHPVRLEQPNGVDHDGVYRAEVAAPLILDWLARDVPHTG